MPNQLELYVIHQHVYYIISYVYYYLPPTILSTGMFVTIIGGERIHSTNYDEYFNVTASVRRVFKMKGQKRQGDIVSFLVCDLPNELLSNDRPLPRTRLLIMGRVDKSYGLVVDGSGYLERRQGNSRRKGRSC